MVCACYLLFQFTYFSIILGYPLMSLYKADKARKIEEKWTYYFFYFIIFYFCELTILFPIKWLLNKIDFCMFPTLKALISLWLYYPGEKNGINLIGNIIGDKLELAFVKINGICGKFAEKIGIENKDIAATQKKTE